MPKRGQIVKGKVVKVEPNRILLDLNTFTEGTIYLDGYANPAPASFFKIVKEGDEVEAKIMKVSEGDDSSVILLSRLPLLANQTILDLEAAFNNQTLINTKVKLARDKGLVLDYKGTELFLPYSLLDFDLASKKEELVNQALEVMVAEFKRGPRLKVIATRKPIYEQAKQAAQAARSEARMNELDSITTGMILEGTVEKLDPHAAQIKFQHVSGMLRISQVSHYKLEKISDILKLGEKVEVKVIKKEGHRLDLSMKALQKTPFALYLEQHRVGQKVEGTVVQKLAFGIIVELAKDVRGLLHKNEYSWNPADNFDASVVIGDKLELVILSKDGAKERISLSKKALDDNPWLNVEFSVGKDYEVLVTDVTKEGLKVAAQGVDGIINQNEISNDKIKFEDHYQKGDRIIARVIKFDRNAWNLEFSIKRIAAEAERKEFEKYLKEDQETEAITLGDVFKDLKNK